MQVSQYMNVERVHAVHTFDLLFGYKFVWIDN